MFFVKTPGDSTAHHSLLRSILIHQNTHRSMKNTYTPSKQMKGCKNIFAVPTKTDSRSSETQKRLYASPNGTAFKLLAKHSITSELLQPNQSDSSLSSCRSSQTSVLDQQMNIDTQSFNLDDFILSLYWPPRL